MDGWLGGNTNADDITVSTAQACSNALIALAPEPWNNSTIYEVNIGQSSNTQILIRKDGVNIHSVTADGVLSCDVTRPFWISW